MTLQESDFDKQFLIELAVKTTLLEGSTTAINEILNGRTKIDVLIILQSIVSNTLVDMITTSESVGGNISAKKMHRNSIDLNGMFLLMKGMSISQTDQQRIDP